MIVFLVDLGTTFQSPNNISGLSGWGGLKTFSKDIAPDILDWDDKLEVIKAMTTKARSVDVNTPLLVTEPKELEGKLAAILGESGQRAFWSTTSIQGFRYRWVQILSASGVYESLLIGMPRTNFCALAFIRKIA